MGETLRPVIERFEIVKASDGKHWCIRDKETGRLYYQAEDYGKSKADEIKWAMNFALNIAARDL